MTRRHRKKWGVCQKAYCKGKAVSPDYLFCNTHNLKEHARYRQKHADEVSTEVYEFHCVPCGHRKERRMKPELQAAWVKSGWLRCPECGAGAGLVTLELADQRAIGSPWAVTAACGIPRGFIS